jgi:hypothetical protein
VNSLTRYYKGHTIEYKAIINRIELLIDDYHKTYKTAPNAISLPKVFITTLKMERVKLLGIEETPEGWIDCVCGLELKESNHNDFNIIKVYFKDKELDNLDFTKSAILSVDDTETTLPTKEELEKMINGAVDSSHKIAQAEKTLADTGFGALFSGDHLLSSIPMQEVEIYPKEAIQQLKEAVGNPTYEKITHWQGVEIQENKDMNK